MIQGRASLFIELRGTTLLSRRLADSLQRLRAYPLESTRFFRELPVD
jgi:hypothetical protein